MDSSILKKIKALPPLDETVIMIQRICSDKNSSMQDLIKVVERDPMLTANILKSANSPLYGFSKEIKNAAHAISLFGMATIRGFALSSAIKENIKIDLEPYGINKHKFLDISTMQSAFMFKWYSKVDRSMLDVLQPASFMMEIGKIIIAHELIESGKGKEFRSAVLKETNIEQLSKLEKEMVGYTNEEITAKIFEKWNLEDELIESIEFSINPFLASEHMQKFAKALYVVKTSINIFGELKEEQVQNALELLKDYDLGEETYKNILEHFTD
ncbi:MAG: HDOD domain-containing protein [Epsilonproteobacteria bacterium]|nr:HDOD domain-containing protein [Campylobacterota bacterium]